MDISVEIVNVGVGFNDAVGVAALGDDVAMRVMPQASQPAALHMERVWPTGRVGGEGGALSLKIKFDCGMEVRPACVARRLLHSLEKSWLQLK